MSIIRSNIARQLLAEGGAPRKGYVTGGDIEDDVAQMETSMGISGGPSPSEYSGLDQESQAEVDADRFRAGFRTPDYISMGVSDDATDRGFFQRGIDALGAGLQNRRGQNILNFLNRSTAPTMRGRLGLGKPGDINYVLDLLQNPDDRVYGLSNKERQIGEKLIDAGIKDEFDIRNMTQAQFDSLFPGPTKSEGGDSEPIRRLRAPITEKKEEPKDEFADILKFYGARFARGGSTGFEGSPEMGGRGTEETYGFDQSGPAGDSGDGGDEPPISMRGETEPPMLPGGRGIDVGALERQGLTPAEIATVFNDYYGLDTGPRVAGPLGQAGLGALTTPAPAPLMGQQVPGGLLGVEKGTTGTKGTQPTGFNVKDVQPTSGYGGKKDQETGKALADFLKEAGPDFLEAAGVMQKSLEPYGGPKFEDGGEVRQEYGLGSIVKKAVGAVKKVAKSPIGKAAILGFGLKFAKPDLFSNIFAKDSFIMKNKALSGILAASLASGLYAKQEEEDEKLPTVANTDPEMTKFVG
jgi:hypothetical protein